jgi:beta-mannosidase
MARTFAEWRRDASGCRGALVWLLRDLWPGAGFGLVEQSGAPKSCYFALRRVLAPVALLAIDEGLNGLTFVAKNERTSPLSADVEISAYHRSSLVKRVSQAVLVPARGELAIDTEEVAGTFFDPTRAYRFGPPNADLVVAKLVVPGARAPIAEAAYFPLGLPSEIDPELVLEARGARLPDGTIDVHLRATRTATFVGVDVLGYEAHDDGFHMEPGSERVVRLSPVGAAPPSFLSGTVHALNAPSEARVRFDAEGAP